MRVAAYNYCYTLLYINHQMKKELLGVRITATVAAAARARAADEGLCLTAVVERALIESLGLGDGAGNELSLAARVADIEQRLSQIEASGQVSRARGKGRR
jgi:hypothetical protein